jgi:hypothetical protein
MFIYLKVKHVPHMLHIENNLEIITHCKQSNITLESYREKKNSMYKIIISVYVFTVIVFCYSNSYYVYMQGKIKV